MSNKLEICWCFPGFDGFTYLALSSPDMLSISTDFAARGSELKNPRPMESTPACYKCFPGYKCPSHRPVSIEVSFMYDQQCLLQMPVNLVVEPDETLASLKRRVIAAAGNRGSHVNPET